MLWCLSWITLILFAEMVIFHSGLSPLYILCVSLILLLQNTHFLLDLRDWSRFSNGKTNYHFFSYFLSLLIKARTLKTTHLSVKADKLFMLCNKTNTIPGMLFPMVSKEKLPALFFFLDFLLSSIILLANIPYWRKVIK